MNHVQTHAAPMPKNSTQSSHDCPVGSGSYAAWYRSNANAAPTDTPSCDSSIQPIRIAGV